MFVCEYICVFVPVGLLNLQLNGYRFWTHPLCGPSSYPFR